MKSKVGYHVIIYLYIRVCVCMCAFKYVCTHVCMSELRIYAFMLMEKDVSKFRRKILRGKTSCQWVHIMKV
jgi:hypothetical protein